MKYLMALVLLQSVQNFSYATETLNLNYPKIIGWQNTPIIEFINNKKADLKKEQILKDAFVVVTSNGDEAELRFSHGEEITVLEKSRIQVPQVSPDTGEAPEFFIFDGAIRFESTQKMTGASRLQIKSAFFDLKLPVGLDVLIEVDKKKPSAQFKVIKGEMTVAFLDFDQKVVLKSGESILFVGENDEKGNLKYDYFLEGKRMPHGSLKEKDKFDISDYIEKEKAILKARAEETARVKKVEATKVKKKKLVLASFLCHEPLGQRDECYWKKIETKCFRYRCNVSGQWGDETERPMIDKCVVKPVSSLCDY